ncbi:hypothetical protein BC826DRAFT_967135 [Russula brevipes]|nr:hypothetical protein BC826DRAFT_967135 [Russula brevipes]
MWLVDFGFLKASGAGMHCFIRFGGRHSIHYRGYLPSSNHRIWLCPASRNNAIDFLVDVLLASCYKSEAPNMASPVPGKSGTSIVKSLRRCKPLKPDAMSAPVHAVPSVPCTPTKKRARKDTLDENGASGGAVATIRAHNSIEDVRDVKGSSDICSRRSTDPRKSSVAPLRARPLSEINHAPGDPPQRRLRRVGTIEFPTMRAPDSDSSDPCNRSSMVPVPIRRVSTPLGDDTSPQDHARSSKYVPSQTIAAAPGPAPRVSLDRFDLRVAPVKEHTELWDLPDDCRIELRAELTLRSSLCAWPGILVLTDNEPSVRFPPIHAVEIECATHAYEGRFSTETNALPVFSTNFRGTTFSKKELAEAQVFDPSLGIIMQEEWSDAQVRKNQWYIKFWVPIPISLFRKKETRMFRLKASVSAVDDRMWKKVTVSSGAVVADISHLRKHKDMDGAAVRA